MICFSNHHNSRQWATIMRRAHSRYLRNIGYHSSHWPENVGISKKIKTNRLEFAIAKYRHIHLTLWIKTVWIFEHVLSMGKQKFGFANRKTYIICAKLKVVRNMGHAMSWWKQMKINRPDWQIQARTSCLRSFSRNSEWVTRPNHANTSNGWVRLCCGINSTRWINLSDNLMRSKAGTCSRATRFARQDAIWLKTKVND